MSLSIAGTQLLKDGKVFGIKAMQSGSNANIQLNDSPTQWWGLPDVQFIKSRGGNFLEINQIPFSLYINSDGSINATQFTKTIDKWSQWALSEQIYLLITFDHMRGSGVPGWMRGTLSNDQFELDFYDQTKTAQNNNRSYVKALWTYIANRYKSNSYVLFNFFNEPFYSNQLITKTTADLLSKNYITFEQQLYDAVRATGATNLIVVDHPATYFYSPNLVDIAREVAYEVHAYVGDTDSFSYWKNWIDQYVTLYVTGFKRPLFIGEFGFIFGSTGMITNEFPQWKEKLSQQVAYLKTLTIIGWQWHDYNWLYSRWYNDYYSKALNKPIFTLDESKFICDVVFDCKTLTFDGVLSAQETPNEPVQITVEKPDNTTEVISIPTDQNGAYKLTKPYAPGAYKVTGNVPAGKALKGITTTTIPITLLGERTLTLTVS